jgi:hypothetical protein
MSVGVVRVVDTAVDASAHVFREARIDVAVDFGESAAGMDRDCGSFSAGGRVRKGKRREGRRLC